MVARKTRALLATVFAAVLAFVSLAPSVAYAKDANLGVTVGDGVPASATFSLNQKGIRETTLALIREYRQDALEDTRVTVDGLTVAQYLERHGISREQYLSPQWSNALERIAIQRAAESNLSFSHTRPNGSDCFTARYDNRGSSGEILASSGDIEVSMSMWASEKEDYIAAGGEFASNTGHYAILIDPSYVSYGFGSVDGYCAGEASINSADTTATNLSGEYEVTIGLPASAVKADALTPSTTSVGVGKSAEVWAKLSYSGRTFTLDATLSSKDASVAKVSGFNVTGVKAGSTTLTMTAGGVSKSFTFYVGVSPMYRLYNKYTGEHFYTASTYERDSLVGVGWTSEGTGWIAPEESSTPVYRLYNSHVQGGDHHYTTSAYERDQLVKVGWTYEGVGWYSDDSRGVPLYRQYNPNAKTGTHNYTSSTVERDHLLSVGWRNENIAWYGMKP